MRKRRMSDSAALLELYAAADRLLAGWGCDASTDCCHFGRTGREPELWPNEWALIARALAARPLPKPRGLPIAQERRCPLLATNGRCAVYAERPFGCRTYYCDRATGPSRRPPRRELAEVGRRIAMLAEKDSTRSGGGPRALTAWLAAGAK